MPAARRFPQLLAKLRPSLTQDFFVGAILLFPEVAHGFAEQLGHAALLARFAQQPAVYRQLA